MFMYGLQDMVEKLGISGSDLYLNTVCELIKLGGSKTLELWLYRIVRHSVK